MNQGLHLYLVGMLTPSGGYYSCLISVNSGLFAWLVQPDTPLPFVLISLPPTNGSGAAVQKLAHAIAYSLL